MKEITAAKAAEYAECALYCGPAGNTADRVERDSRNAGPGSIFIGLIGKKNDGNRFAGWAYQNGCRIFLLSDEKTAAGLSEKYGDASVILADDTLSAMQRLAKNYLTDCSGLIRVAVTGSVGKTSTKDMLYRIFSSKYRTICNYENYNNHIGVPLTAFEVGEDTEAGIFEMGMSHSGEIRILADIIKPQTAVITNVGTSHIGNLGSRDAILAAKLEITQFMDESCLLVYNADDDKLVRLSENHDGYKKMAVRMADSGKLTAKTAGETDELGELMISDVKTGALDVSFRLTADGESCMFSVPLPGVHNAYNAALAAACGLRYGISLEESSQALADMTGNAVRLNIMEGSGISVINDTYNASPDSVKAALSVLQGCDAVRRVAVLADMFELGENSHEYHRQIGRYAAGSGTDVLITVGPKARYIAEGALETMKAECVFSFDSLEEFIENAHDIIRTDDTVLVKGSHGMAMNRAAEYLVSAGEWDGR